MKRLRQFLATAGCGFWLAVCGVTFADEFEPPPVPAAGQLSKAETVVVPEARIKLLDDVTLAFDQTGVLESVKFSEGDEVAADAVIAQLQTEVARAQLAIAEKEATTEVNEKFARASYRVAEIELEKALEANELVPGAVPLIEVERLRLASTRADLQIDQALEETALAKLRVNEVTARLKASTLKAPFDGVVTQVFKSVGEAVRQGDSILVLRSTQRVKVEGNVSPKDVIKLKRGQRVLIYLPNTDYDGDPIEGRLHFVDLAANPVSGLFRIWAEVHNPDGVLRGGLTAEMQVLPGEAALVKPLAPPAKP